MSSKLSLIAEFITDAVTRGNLSTSEIRRTLAERWPNATDPQILQAIMTAILAERLDIEACLGAADQLRLLQGVNAFVDETGDQTVTAELVADHVCGRLPDANPALARDLAGLVLETRYRSRDAREGSDPVGSALPMLRHFARLATYARREFGD
jgi:hypothetical protein